MMYPFLSFLTYYSAYVRSYYWASITYNDWLIVHVVDFKLQSPHFKLHGWSLTQRLLNVAGPTLTSDVVSTFPKQDTSVRYDIDYLPEAEARGQTSHISLGKAKFFSRH